MVVDWNNGQRWLLIPDQYVLDYELNQPVPYLGFTRIIIDEDLVVKFRESRFYKQYMMSPDCRIAKIYISRNRGANKQIPNGTLMLPL